MSSEQIGHPDDLALLQYTDGEMGAREAAEVWSHVESCERCRKELERTERALAAFAGHQESVLPPAPAEWADLSGRFEEADRSTRRTLAIRVLAASRKWLPVAAGVVVVWFAAQRLTETPSARAAELLRKAAVAESQAKKPRRILIRTRTQRLTRVIGRTASAAVSPIEIPGEAPLKAMFQAANYSWEDPLSATSFQQWRDRLAEKRDEVTPTGDGFQVRTATDQGALAQASLTLRAEDLRAVEGTLEFRNSERVELSELPYQPAEGVELANEPESRVAPAAPPVEAPPAEKVDAPATAGDELRVFAALRRLGADLGEPIEVARSGGRVTVTGIGMDPQRAGEIESALRGLARVHVEFHAGQPPAVPAPESGARGVTGAGATQLQAQLEKALGGRAIFEQFSDVLLQKTEALMARAHALRRLSRRFPEEVEAQLDDGERRMLAGLRGDLAASFAQQQNEIQRTMAPALRDLALGQPAVGVVSAESWQAAVEQLFQAAWRLDRLAAVIFGGASGEGAGEPTASLLATRLEELEVLATSYGQRFRAE